MTMQYGKERKKKWSKDRKARNKTFFFFCSEQENKIGYVENS